jgi:arginyl-tRNA--protein-N-Asp/Glu arginylyltransferase
VSQLQKIGRTNPRYAAYRTLSMPLPPPVGVRLTTLPPQDCNYLPGRIAVSRAFWIDEMPGGMYHKFMDAGFRRSGTVVYQPACPDCQRCVPIRVPVADFTPNKSQRRCARLNADLIITESEPELTDEKFELYRRYLVEWHGRDPAKADDREALEEFLYQSPVRTIEFSYRTPSNKLIGVGLADVCDQAFSTVYFYFDPAESWRSLGTFSALHEINWCRESGLAFYYLGFWIHGCASMQYKSHFQPAEVLGLEGTWGRLVESSRKME